MRTDEGQATERRQAGLGAARRPRCVAFGETANPAEYVPREATERALRELEREARRGRATALTSPPGLGRTLLLRILAQRLHPGFCCPFLPYAALGLDELCAWTLGLLDGGLLDREATDAPQAMLLAEARRRTAEGRPLVLLIDDAGSMPLATARGLSGLVRDSGSRLRLVVGAADDAASSRMLAALHPEIAEVRFTKPMTALETRLYVETRLEQAGVLPARRGAIDAAALGWIHRLSGGVPRRVHELAGSLLEDAPEGVARAWSEEQWLGAPLEDIDSDGELADEDGEEVAAEPQGPGDPRLDPPEPLLDGDDPEIV